MYRSDGYRVSTDDPMYEIAAYVMDKRYDASNSIKQYIDYAPLQQYMIKCRKDGINMSHNEHFGGGLSSRSFTESLSEQICHEQEDICAEPFLRFFCHASSGEKQEHRE